MGDFSSDIYKQLKHKVHQRLKEDKLEDKIFEVVRTAYNELLISENVVLTRTENHRLLRDIITDELTDMLNKLGASPPK